MPGISGLALRVPRPRVALDAWCGWTGVRADKVRAVVGDAFRVPARHEDVYTLAADAVLRLLDAYAVRPEQVGLLVLATESSTDNAVGGPTVRGMVDAGLRARGGAPLPASVETYEVKQACLAGINGLLAAARFVALEPDRVALVVAADIAEYARGSSGEQTQGAGAVAALVEAEPTLVALDLARVGRFSADRAFDFRKPARAPGAAAAAWPEARPRDVPTFAGHYSTHCYVDAVDRAFRHLVDRVPGSTSASVLEAAQAILLHRPYEKMPQTAMARLWLRSRLETEEGRAALGGIAAEARVELGAALRELEASRDLVELARTKGVETDPHPALSALTRAASRSGDFGSFLAPRVGLGRDVVRQLGNLYSASLPAWLGAALEDAASRATALEGPILLLGYGSGDAALAVTGTLVPGWRDAAGRLGFARALEGAIDLDRRAYEDAHDRVRPIELEPRGEPALIEVGDGSGLGFDDRGIPRYAYVG